MKNIGKRIIVIGSPGSGKSTFSRKLSDKTGIPLIHLDKEFGIMDGLKLLGKMILNL